MAAPTSTTGWEELGFKLGTIFKPTSPLSRDDMFKGRYEQMRSVIDVINQPGGHAVLFGEMGVGKTTASNMIFSRLHCSGLPRIMPHVNCQNGDTFDDIWRRVFQEIAFHADTHDIDYELSDQAESALKSATDTVGGDPITPDIVRRVLYLLGQGRVVVIILDEFDITREPSTRLEMANTIKYLSDRNVPATIILVGVADDIEDLIENHRSVERCLSQIHLPRLSRDEIEGIIVTGLHQCDGMSIKKDGLHEISRIAKGLPHYAHLLGLQAGRAAIDKRSMVVSPEHVRTAIKCAIQQAQSSIKNLYIDATTSARKDAKYKEVLLACALADADELGYFYPADVRPALSRIEGKDREIADFAKHLHAFCDSTKGGVLIKDERTSRARYRFDNPMLQPFVLLRGLDDGTLTEEDLQATRNKKDPQGRLF